MKCQKGPQIWAGTLEWHKHRKMDMWSGTWNVRTLYRTSSLKTLSSDLAKYNLDQVAVQGSQMGWRW